MKEKCVWATSDILEQYHDNEWGRIVKQDNKLFEIFILETMSVGLSWELILKKRDTYRKIFSNFDIDELCKWTKKEIENIINNQNLQIVKSEPKIKSIFTNAHLFKTLIKEFGNSYKYFWNFCNNKQVIRDYASKKDWINKHEISNRLSEDLKNRGFKFVGPVIMYSFVQAIGMVEDHQNNCFLKKELN